MDNREEFLKRINATFKIEAREGIQKISSNLIDLENSPSKSRLAELVESTFREAHSLKGASRAVNQTGMESICQSMENVFSSIKKEGLIPSKKIIDVFHLSVNLLEDLTEQIGSELSAEANEKIDEILVLIFELENKEAKKPNIETPEIVTEQTSQPELQTKTQKVAKENPIRENINSDEKTIRISTDKLNNLLNNAEELLSLKLKSAQYVKDLNRILISQQIWNKQISQMQPFIKKCIKTQNQVTANGNEIKTKTDFSNLAELFDSTLKHVRNLEDELLLLKHITRQNAYETALKVDNFTTEIKNILSVPFSTILSAFPKICRDLSKDLNKEVKLILKGDDIRIDRRILEMINNPLLHILRNCIDHGIEKPEERKQKNKPEKGTLIFNIALIENDKVEIKISDNGAGIDLNKLRKKYISVNEISPENIPGISDSDLLDFIFQSGITTSEIITELSGRGLGLAIVREKIEQLCGEINVKTQFGEGTEFTIIIPLSLVNFRGVHVRAGNQSFIFPTLKINKIVQVKKTDIKTINNKTNISVDEKTVSLVHLADALQIQRSKENSEFFNAILTGTQNNQVAFAIDEILEEEEILAKNFNRHLEHVRNISGATVLGSGKVVLILNVDELTRTTVNTAPAHFAEPTETLEINKPVLVVEDSITSRMLLKNILETAGYNVSTAVDGVDGFTKLKEGDFKLVVTDVDMPRMNGFDLTAKIRGDKTFAELPVVLVTSLSKTEDREHGMEVGANAYIVKSSFDQSNLLEVIERLI